MAGVGLGWVGLGLGWVGLGWVLNVCIYKGYIQLINLVEYQSMQVVGAWG